MKTIEFNAMVTGLGGLPSETSGIEFLTAAGTVFFELPSGDCRGLAGFIFKNVRVTLQVAEIPEGEAQG